MINSIFLGMLFVIYSLNATYQINTRISILYLFSLSPYTLSISHNTLSPAPYPSYSLFIWFSFPFLLLFYTFSVLSTPFFYYFSLNLTFSLFLLFLLFHFTYIFLSMSHLINLVFELYLMSLRIKLFSAILPLLMQYCCPLRIKREIGNENYNAKG